MVPRCRTAGETSLRKQIHGLDSKLVVIDFSPTVAPSRSASDLPLQLMDLNLDWLSCIYSLRIEHVVVVEP